MDEDLRKYFEALEGRLTASMSEIGGRLTARVNEVEGRLAARVNEVEGRLTARMNDQHELILNRLTSLEGDFQNTKGYLVEDSVISGRRWLDQEARLSRLEKRAR